MKQGLCGPCGIGPNPRSMAFFLRFQESKACSPGYPRHYPVCHWWDITLSGRFMWCGGYDWVLKRQVRSWDDDVGVSGSNEVGLKVQPHLIKAAEWCVFQGKERWGRKLGSWFWQRAVQCEIWYHTHKHQRTESRALSEHCWQNDTAWRSQGLQAGCTTVIPTQPSCGISLCNLTCQQGQGAIA